MEISKEVKNKFTHKALFDFFWALEKIKEKLNECNESYISNNAVKIYIDEKIRYVNFKKYKFKGYNNALLIFGDIERNTMLNDKRRKGFNVMQFRELVEKRITSMMLNKLKVNEKVRVKNKRKRIPIDIKTYSL